jgi:hypothetical protein
MNKSLTGIVLTIVGIFELSLFLIGIIAVPFPHMMENILVKDLNEELQKEFEEMMSDQSFMDQIIDQLSQAMQMTPLGSPNQNPNQNDGEYQNNENLNNLLFDFQIADESVEPMNPQSEVQGAMQVPDSRTDTIVPVSEWHVGCVDTVPGKIEFKGYIDHVLPLCWTEDNDPSDNWWLEAYVTGGYTPLLGPSVMYLSQYDKDAQEYKCYKIKINWVLEEKGECCAEDIYYATFEAELPICFDSNQYPEISGHPGFRLCTPDQDTIPGKKVGVMIMMDWAGCEEDDQHFKILSVRDKYQFSCL